MNETTTGSANKNKNPECKTLIQIVNTKLIDNNIILTIMPLLVNAILIVTVNIIHMQ